MSLKWKTVLFLVALLLTVTAGFVLREQDVLEQQYRALRDNELGRQVALSREAVRQRLAQLQTVAGIVAMRNDVRESLGKGGAPRFAQDFSDQSSALQINMGLVSLRVINRDGAPVEENSTYGSPDAAQVSTGPFLAKHMETIRSEHPQFHAACQAECLLFAWAPALHEGRAVGTVMVAAPITDAILAFYRVTHADFGIVSTAALPPSGRPTLTDGATIMALTGGAPVREVVSRIKKVWQTNSAGFRRQEILHEQSRYEVARWPVDPQMADLPAEFIAVTRVDEAHAAIQQVFRTTMLGAGGVLLFALAISWLLTRRFLRGLKLTADAIHLLGEKSYQAVREKLAPVSRKLYFRDELDTVNRITLEVADILEALEIEVGHNQDKLIGMVAALEREHEFVAELIDTAPVLIVAHNTHGEITLVNLFAVELTGISLQDWRGQSFVECFFPPEEAGQARTLIAQAHRDGNAARQESTLVTAIGRRDIVWVHCRLALHSSAEPLMLSVGQDITLLKELQAESEQRLRQLQLSQKMQAIGQLTGGIAHDFNNILASIMGYTGLARERYATDKEGKLARYLDEVYRAAERARDLVAQMLAFSRGSGSERHPVPLPPLIKEVLKMLRPVFPASLTITTEIEQVPPVTANLVQLQQIVMNLAINARDAIHERGNIVIGLHRRQIFDGECSACQSAVHGDFVEISVTDTGCGITPEHLQRIFDPFFTTKAVGKGTGLGLSVVHGLVHDFGGHLQVESTPGAGSVFRVLLPAPADVATPSTTPGSAAEPALETSGAISATRVLIVDDDRSIAYYLGELLEMRGMRVSVETDAAHALANFSAQPGDFDMVLCDQAMPALTGVELAKRIREIRRDLPIILCSGKWDTETESRALELGAVKLIGKPIRTELLFELINGFISSDPKN